MALKSKIGFSSTLKAKHIPRPKASILWKMRNLPNVLPGLAKHKIASILNMNHMIGTLRALHIAHDGAVTDYGLISCNLVTTAFVNDMVDELITETATWGDYKFHDSGVGVTGAAVGDVDIETTDGESRATGTQVEDAANIYESVGTISYTSTKAITEHGLFNVVTDATPTLMDRHTFAAINVVNGDSVQFTFDLTCTAGG